jgi:hypothetical protein
MIVLVGALCTAFYFFGKGHKEIVNEIDTLKVTTTDTIQVTIKDTVIVTDTVHVVETIQGIYEIVQYDTLLTQDSCKVNLKIDYNEYTNEIGLGMQISYPRVTNYITKTVESSLKESLFYGGLFVAKNKDEALFAVKGGLFIKHVYIGGVVTTNNHIGLEIGGRF